MSLPDFLLLGAPKAGTTALHVALARHPELFLSPVKEPKFFLTDGPPPRGGGPGDDRTYRAYVWRRSDYEQLFAAAPAGTLRGESTTLYLADHASHLRVRELIPDAKLIAVVRDPVDRAHSNWMHLRSAGLEPEADFLRACELEERRLAADWGPFWGYTWQSRYGSHVAHLLEVFPRSQLLLLVYRDVRTDPAGTLERICAFLGVAAGQLSGIPAENVTAQARGGPGHGVVSAVLRRVVSALPQRLSGPVEQWMARVLQRDQRTRVPLTAAQRTQLLPTFLDDITQLERVTGMSFAHWRDADNGRSRPALPTAGPIGTAHGSIDRPVPKL